MHSTNENNRLAEIQRKLSDLVEEKSLLGQGRESKMLMEQIYRATGKKGEEVLAGPFQDRPDVTEFEKILEKVAHEIRLDYSQELEEKIQRLKEEEAKEIDQATIYVEYADDKPTSTPQKPSASFHDLPKDLFHLVHSFATDSTASLLVTSRLRSQLLKDPNFWHKNLQRDFGITAKQREDLTVPQMRQAYLSLVHLQKTDPLIFKLFYSRITMGNLRNFPALYASELDENTSKKTRKFYQMEAIRLHNYPLVKWLSDPKRGDSALDLGFDLRFELDILPDNHFDLQMMAYNYSANSYTLIRMMKQDNFELFRFFAHALPSDTDVHRYETLLKIAAENKNKQFSERLISEINARVGSSDLGDAIPPLINDAINSAYHRGNPDFAHLSPMLEAGITTLLENEKGEDLLSAAILSHNTKFIDDLIAKGTKPTMFTMWTAFRNNKLDFIKEMLDRPEIYTHIKELFRHPLGGLGTPWFVMAVKHSELPLMQMILTNMIQNQLHPKKVARLNNDFSNVLEIVVTNGHLDAVKYCLNPKAEFANIIRRDINFESLFLAAIRSGNVDMVKCVSQEAPNFHADTATLVDACPNREMIQYLVDEIKILDLSLPYSSVTIEEMQIEHPTIPVLVKKGDISILEYLIEKNLLTPTTEETLATAIHYGHFDMLKYLIEKHGLTPSVEMLRRPEDNDEANYFVTSEWIRYLLYDAPEAQRLTSLQALEMLQQIDATDATRYFMNGKFRGELLSKPENHSFFINLDSASKNRLLSEAFLYKDLSLAKTLYSLYSNEEKVTAADVAAIPKQELFALAMLEGDKDFLTQLLHHSNEDLKVVPIFHEIIKHIDRCIGCAYDRQINYETLVYLEQEEKIEIPASVNRSIAEQCTAAMMNMTVNSLRGKGFNVLTNECQKTLDAVLDQLLTPPENQELENKNSPSH